MRYNGRTTKGQNKTRLYKWRKTLWNIRICPLPWIASRVSMYGVWLKCNWTGQIRGTRKIICCPNIPQPTLQKDYALKAYWNDLRKYWNPIFNIFVGNEIFIESTPNFSTAEYFRAASYEVLITTRCVTVANGILKRQWFFLNVFCWIRHKIWVNRTELNSYIFSDCFMQRRFLIYLNISTNTFLLKLRYNKQNINENIT